MKKPTRKQVVLGALGVLVAVALVFAFLPSPVPVQTETVKRGPLQVLVEEEGETRLRDRYTITSPVAAFVRRIELEPGDVVEAGQPLVRLEPPRSAIQDPRSRAEALARVDAARANLSQAEVVLGQATQELERAERLLAGGAATRQQHDAAAAEVARARGQRDAARAELTAAQAAMPTDAGQRILPVRDTLLAPASGRVLAVHRREGYVNPGEPLIEVGDTESLEIAVDVLTQDAVRIGPGTRVLLDQWGAEPVVGNERNGPAPLEAVVRRVEPQGFAVVSALGVEERRVTVRAEPVTSIAAFLGPGYRVLARFIVWESPDVIQVPSAALFRHDGGWATFVVEKGRAVLRPVAIGQQAGLVSEVLAGLGPGDVVIVHPANDIQDGARVQPDGG